MRTRHVRTLSLSVWLLTAWLLTITMFVGTAHAHMADRRSLRASAKTHTARMNREHWRREAVGRWVTERVGRPFLILRKDGTYESGYYENTQLRIDSTGTYTVTADGSVTMTFPRFGPGNSGTYQRQEDLLSEALPVPMGRVLWHKESGLTPPAPAPEWAPLPQPLAACVCRQTPHDWEETPTLLGKRLQKQCHDTARVGKGRNR